jgi:glycine/D-amino acid oxidase-like deaminating enzyme
MALFDHLVESVQQVHVLSLLECDAQPGGAQSAECSAKHAWGSCYEGGSVIAGVDVAVIGGGIIGAASAAYLADAGLSVALFEEREIAAGASGRNSGAIQRPGGAQLAALQVRSLELYRELAAVDDALDFPAQPAGLLVVSPDANALEALVERLRVEHPELQPALIRAGDPLLTDHGLASDIGACRLEDAYPVAPAVTTQAFARRAARAGVSVLVGQRAAPEIADGAVIGVRLSDGSVVPAGQVLIAAGPATPGLVPGWSARPPIEQSWGVVVGTTLPTAPRPVLEELGIEARGGPTDMLFSLVSVGGVSSVGSTFLRDRPDPNGLAGAILRRAARFVPALAEARAESVRLCARPLAFDGRPLIGRIGEVRRLFVCAGHGPWGISTGAASARLIADVMLGTAQAPAELDPGRWPVF